MSTTRQRTEPGRGLARLQSRSRAGVEADRLTGEIVDAALAAHRALGPFYQGVLYRNALAVELRRRGVRCQKSVAISVTFRGEVVGNHEADAIVEDCVLLKITAEGSLDPRHKDQLMRGIGDTALKHGLLLDFGGPELLFCRIL